MPVPRIPEMPQLIVGTAGHVDHGKTALVKLLTGCDTDHLKEEKQRGLSIDLGFAPCRISNNRMVGVVDVPGHIDFIRNMVAGASSIDILILTIAADDGVMPQTVEHMQIIKLLKAPKVIVALTKIDLVDQEMLELVTEDVREFIAEMGYPDAPVVPVSNITLEGISSLKETLDLVVDEFEYNESNRFFRLDVARVFSVPGHGTVVTGIPVSGSIEAGQNLDLFPGRKAVRIRSIQNYKFEKPVACANICCAINISDLKAEQISRGMALCQKDCFSDTLCAFASLQNIHKSFTIKHNTVFRFHAGTAEVKVKVKLLNSNTLEPGQAMQTQLVLDAPLVLSPGDKFIIRRLSPSVTVAGGVVLSCDDYKYKRSDNLFVDRLNVSAKVAGEGDFAGAALLAGRSPVFNKQELERVSLTNDPSLLERLLNSGFVTVIEEDCFFVNERTDELLVQLQKLLKNFHQKYKYTWGMTPADVGEHLNIPHKSVRPFLTPLLKGYSEIIFKFGRYALSSFSPAISSQQLKQKDDVCNLVEQAGFQGISVNEILDKTAVKSQDLKLYINILLEENAVVTLGKHIMMRESFELCIQRVREFFNEHDVLEVNQFRDMVNCGRNMAVAILEKMDAAGLTRRVENGRILL